MLRHWVYLRIQLFLYLYHVLLIPLCDQVDSKTNLPKSARSTNSMQIGIALERKIKVDNNIDSLHINSSGNQVGTNKSLELSLPKPLKHLYPLIRFHIRMQVLILITLLIQLLR